MKGVIIDLDQTLIDSSVAEIYRGRREWSTVYSLIPKFQIYEGIYDLLSGLKASKIKIAVVTTSHSIYADKVLRYFNISYNCKVCYHDCKLKKPHPDQYLAAMEGLALKKTECIALGDRDIDIQAAHNAHILSGACYWGSSDPISLRNSSPSFNFMTVVDAISFFGNI